MYTIGMDVSLKSIGLVDVKPCGTKFNVLYDNSKLGLKISSSLTEINNKAEHIAQLIPANSTVVIDATQYRFKAMKGQQEQLHSFIGCIVGKLDNCTLLRVEPKSLRKVCGLPHNVNKSLCWLHLPFYLALENYSEHVLDAATLAYVYNVYPHVETW